MFLRLKTKRSKNLTLIRHHFKLHHFQHASFPASFDNSFYIINHGFFSTGTIENRWFKIIKFLMNLTHWTTETLSSSSPRLMTGFLLQTRLTWHVTIRKFATVAPRTLVLKIVLIHHSSLNCYFEKLHRWTNRSLRSPLTVQQARLSSIWTVRNALTSAGREFVC